MTGQPDFATIRIRYVPDQTCVELKSLKLYLWCYRDEGAFHEAVTNRILNDLVAALDPRRSRYGDFTCAAGSTRWWSPATRSDLPPTGPTGRMTSCSRASSTHSSCTSRWGCC